MMKRKLMAVAGAAAMAGTMLNTVVPVMAEEKANIVWAG